MKKCFIVLENGNVFEGTRFGSPACATGELIFTTSAGSYMGTLTDPCHAGRIVLQTFPTIGNYGEIPAEQDSPKCHLSGYVVREWCETPSNFRSEGDLNSYLISQNVAGVCGVDTRQIARIIRENGTMNAAICDEVTPELIQQLKSHKAGDLLKQVATFSRAVLPAGDAKAKLAFLNLGAPHGLIEAFNEAGYEVHEFPYDATADELSGYDLLVLGDGPGDPRAADAAQKVIESLAGKQPILALGLGHLLLAQALDGKIVKLKHGHHGSNQPVKDLGDGKMSITTQNEGYTVSPDPLPRGARITHINFNDNSVAALKYEGIQAISMGFIPQDGTLIPSLERLVK